MRTVITVTLCLLCMFCIVAGSWNYTYNCGNAKVVRGKDAIPPVNQDSADEIEWRGKSDSADSAQAAYRKRREE